VRFLRRFSTTTNSPNTVKLPQPFLSGGLPLVEAISQRRSIRDFTSAPLLLFQLSQILWAAQGITSGLREARASPSAGATYPLEIYVVIGENGIEKIESGIYHYEVESHILSPHATEDIRAELASAALGQDSITVAPVSLIICVVYDRTMIRYNIRGERYVYIEVGHAGQNIYLQATALGLGTVAIGAFHDEEVRKALQLDSKVKPIYIMPLGKPV
jgi:SagB-type dehydrogenase family enzyme